MAKKKLAAQLELESHLISDIVTKATGLDDEVARKKIHDALDLETIKDWRERYQEANLHGGTFDENDWTFLSDCVGGFPNTATAMIQLIKAATV